MSHAKNVVGMFLGAVLVSPLTVGAPAVADIETERPAIEWHTCPRYSDDDLRAQGVADEDFAEFRRLLGRMECGTLSVPQNYADPDGEQIGIGLTRLKATDQENRLGSLALNPGGPGGSGYLMPAEVVMSGVELDDRYDLIGFDPRGVGHSTKVACPEGQGGRPEPGPVTKEQARRAYEETIMRNQECARTDPGFLGQLTTANVARDIDRIRAALDEPKISFLGVSWGTWLGAVLRTLFPGKVDRMWLDSVAQPEPRFDVAMEVRAKAADRDFQRMAAWIAERDDTYGLGTSRRQVVSALEKMRRSYDADPLTFTDIDLTVDGALIAQAASRTSVEWPQIARVFTELVDAKGPTAPPTVKEVFGGSSPPKGQDRTANRAFHCNEDWGSQAFEPAWDAYQKRLERYPVTGRATSAFAPCAGWPLPVQRTRLRPTDGSLMLSGHLYETLAPYEFTPVMRAATGGTVVTIDDDVHGSALRVPGCAAKMIDYFETGRRTSTCPGVRPPG